MAKKLKEVIGESKAAKALAKLEKANKVVCHKIQNKNSVEAPVKKDKKKKSKSELKTDIAGSPPTVGVKKHTTNVIELSDGESPGPIHPSKQVFAHINKPSGSLKEAQPVVRPTTRSQAQAFFTDLLSAIESDYNVLSDPHGPLALGMANRKLKGIEEVGLDEVVTPLEGMHLCHLAMASLYDAHMAAKAMEGESSSIQCESKGTKGNSLTYNQLENVRDSLTLVMKSSGVWNQGIDQAAAGRFIKHGLSAKE